VLGVGQVTSAVGGVIGGFTTSVPDRGHGRSISPPNRSFTGAASPGCCHAAERDHFEGTATSWMGKTLRRCWPGACWACW
jgi:hypothetical protein